MTPVVVAWDPRWPARFAAKRAALLACLRPWLTTDVEHVGSTSVSGMPAKPIIDMVAGVGRLADADAAEPALAALGYVRRPHRVDAVLFVKPASRAEVPDAAELLDAANVHLTVAGGDLWRERLAFRDALRRDRALVARYAALKAELLRANGGRVYDAADKRAFVRQVLADEGVHLRDDRHVAHER